MKKTVKTECNNCKIETHQSILFSKTTKSDDYEGFESAYMVVKCGGCKSLSFLLREHNYNASPDEIQFIDYNYPEKNDWASTNHTFLREEDLDILPRKIYDIYEELKNTFKTDTNTLAGIALRTLVEAICKHQQIEGRDLYSKIQNLNKEGKISASEMPILDKLRLMGNESTHEAASFSTDKLSCALDIVNHLIRSIYVLPKINKRLNLKSSQKNRSVK